jgi:hypothetical protein
MENRAYLYHQHSKRFKNRGARLLGMFAYKFKLHIIWIYNIIVKFGMRRNKNNLNIINHGFDFNDANANFGDPILVVLDTHENCMHILLNY